MLASILACIDVAQGSFVETSAAFAEDVRRCEREFANIVCGYQDAYMVTFGGFRIGDYLGKHPVRSGPTAVLRSLPYQIPLLLVSTGRQRLSGSVHGPLAERWLAGEALVQKQIESISSLPDAALSAMMRSDWLELGQIMNENQAATRLLGGSGEEIDKLVELCIRHGALGAKLAGAGHGGTVIALHPNPNELELVLRNLGYRSFNRVLPQAGLVRHDVR
jgi:galactokinase/mevalonate kinase-like predicted kinase